MVAAKLNRSGKGDGLNIVVPPWQALPESLYGRDCRDARGPGTPLMDMGVISA